MSITIAPPDALTRVTVAAFRRRFPRLAVARIELASLDDPAASPAERLQAAALRADLRELDTSTYIDLRDVREMGRLGPLVALGALTVDEAEAIMSAPVQPEEMPAAGL